jgi:hypothetical protein
LTPFAVAFHCYAGSYKNQDSFTALFPDKEVYFTECTGTIGSNFWGDIKVRLLHRAYQWPLTRCAVVDGQSLCRLGRVRLALGADVEPRRKPTGRADSARYDKLWWWLPA